MQEMFSSNLRETTMIYQYKNQQAEIRFVETFTDFMFGIGGRVELKSDILNCKSAEMSFDGSETTVTEIYKKYFNQKVDEIHL